ncbi:DUF4199 domain-containing protein [Spongiivirga citrea]|uniref:DUF4199 domain-containing protein n=1 Tax=Spongiivirga citrea TaxID=1481457 RepID=UPI001954567E|nr:DUF4199 domain-containing protein [Spongiivirga citrea]
MIKRISTEIKWGAILSVIAVLWGYLEKSLGWHDEKVSMYLIYSMSFGVPALLVYFFALKEKRDLDYNRIMDWKQLAVSGAIIGTVVAAFSPLVQYVTFHFISPDYFSNAIKAGIERGMKQEAAESFYTLESAIKQSALVAIPLGVVAGTIFGLILQKKK